MRDVYLSGLPFLVRDAVARILMMAFPQMVLWLPGRMT
jgi:TRAP-type mannitol/chloroaromatic compound transport system permease large subunit